MPTKPILLLPSPTEPVRRDKLTQDKRRFTTPTAQEQGQRLTQRLESVARSISSVAPAPDGIEPEQTIVFETVGRNISRLIEAAESIEGLEVLAELETDSVVPDSSFGIDGEDEADLPCRFFVVLSNQHAIKRLLSLWSEWVTANGDVTFATGLNPLKQLFAQLNDIRRWGIRDRLLETGIEANWNRDLAERKDNVRFEVELWSRGSAKARIRSRDVVSKIIGELHGRVIDQCDIPAIGYNALLVEMPASSVREALTALSENTRHVLLRCEEVMFFRPMSHAGSISPSIAEDLEATTAEASDLPPVSADPPVAAILDGMPLSNHRLLHDHVTVDDPDDFARYYEVSDRVHGTAMASLVVFGDLNGEGVPARRKVYVRPIFQPAKGIGRIEEYTPPDRLLVDLIHRCVLRLKKGEDGNPPVGPDVRIVNLSLGNENHPFYRQPSALARLLDYLANEFGILFIVSAGNHTNEISLRLPSERPHAHSHTTLRKATLRSMWQSQRHRRLFSPAETVNGVTVGGAHTDSSPPVLHHSYQLDVLGHSALPAPYSTVGTGFNTSVKPDVLFPGGRQLVAPVIGSHERDAVFELVRSHRPPGLSVCAPGRHPGDLGRTVHTRGSSCAAALATNRATQILERIFELRRENAAVHIPESCIAPILKALLVHGAEWGDAVAEVAEAFPEFPKQERNKIARRLLGYGIVDGRRGIDCDGGRVTWLGFGEISRDQAHLFHVPIPLAIGGKRVFRKLSITLAWMSPLNFRHQNYRCANLWFDVEKDLLGSEPVGCHVRPSRKGTVQHGVYEGEKAIVVQDGDSFRLRVNCRDGAGRLRESVAYGLAISLEVAESIGVDVYEQVRRRIRPRASS